MHVLPNRKNQGAIFVDGAQVGITLCCAHCGLHWEPILGSGRKRGYCLSCKDVTCGAAACDPCTPFEVRLDFTEALAGKDSGEIKKMLRDFPEVQPL